MSKGSFMNILITGGSSGIGLSTAKALIKQGHAVYEISRRKDFEMAGLIHFSADVSDEGQVENTVKDIYKMAGSIDICINCAGFGISGAVEFTDIEAAKKQFDVNFFGMVRVNKAVIPHLRKQGHGRIVNISSVAGMAPIPFQTYYSASKAAINSYSMSLANELRPFGLTVCAVMPGDIATGFTDAREKIQDGDDIYGGRIGKSVKGMEKDERSGMSPDLAGAFVAKVALKTSTKPLYAIGIVYKAICSVLLRVLPAQTANWLIRLLYT